MTTGLDVFDKTLETTNNWLKDMMFELGVEDRHKTYEALKAVLHNLRDRLNPGEASDLGAQLPLLIRGMYYEGWNPSQTPVKIRNEQEFLSGIKDRLPPKPALDTERVARAVFKLLAHRVSEGEVQDIKDMLPKEIAGLWPHPA